MTDGDAKPSLECGLCEYTFVCPCVQHLSFLLSVGTNVYMHALVPLRSASQTECGRTGKGPLEDSGTYTPALTVSPLAPGGGWTNPPGAQGRAVRTGRSSAAGVQGRGPQAGSPGWAAEGQASAVTQRWGWSGAGRGGTTLIRLEASKRA